MLETAVSPSAPDLKSAWIDTSDLSSISPMEMMFRLLSCWPYTRLSAREPANTTAAVHNGQAVRHLSHVGPSDLVPFSLGEGI